jgi:hypothetical protein
MAHPWRTEKYEQWDKTTGTLFQDYLKWYGNIGPQTYNAARVEVLKHVREARAQMSDPESQEVWPACGTCDNCGRPISSGEPYRVVSTWRDGGAVDVLQCIECEFAPNVWRVFSPPDFNPWVSFQSRRARAAISAMENERRERWMRQDRLRHRGPWWRLKRWVDWWSGPLWVLPAMALGRQPGPLQRLVAAWRVRRLQSLILKSLSEGPDTPHKERMKKGAQRIVTRYERGGRRFVRANLCGVTLSGANLENADLRRAAAVSANLTLANLTSARLVRADLEMASLSRANLSSADLRDANLYGACLVGADLRQANLKGANVSGANLYEACVTDDQLSRTFSLRGTLLPDGTVHD